MDSFTTFVKDEICQKKFKNCCQKALLSAFMKVNGKISILESKKSIIIHSFHNRTTRLIYQLLKNQFHDITLKIEVKTFPKFSSPKIYEIYILENVDNVIKKLMLLDSQLYIEKKILNKYEEHCIRAYIAGMFLVVGSINSPTTTNYHLELQYNDSYTAQTLQKILLSNFNFNFKIIIRRQKEVLYIKKSNLISDFLKLIDCPKSVFMFEDKRIARELFNNINRFNNIDISNQQKVLNASNEQVIMISMLKNKNIFNELSLKAQIIANLRLENPDASLLELCDLFFKKTGNVISKSGANHLIREIKKKYQENPTN